MANTCIFPAMILITCIQDTHGQVLVSITHCGPWIWVNIGPGLLPDDTKPLIDPVLTVISLQAYVIIRL